jgi:hypothetical protein
MATVFGVDPSKYPAAEPDPNQPDELPDLNTIQFEDIVTTSSRPLKYLPQSDEIKRLVGQYKLKDNGLTGAVELFWSNSGEGDDAFDKDDPDKKLAQLPRILKLATDMKNSKEAKAAGPYAVKYLTELVAVVPTVRKNVEDRKARFEKEGMLPIDVQILIDDWDGRAMSSDYVALTTFAYPGAPEVNITSKITSNGVNLSAVRLKPHGTLSLKVRDPGSAVAYCEGNTAYDFSPGLKFIRFKAVQNSQPGKVSAKNVTELSKKLSVKATVGLEFKILKVGGEVAKEEEYKNGYEKEVEWDVQRGGRGFLQFGKV